MIAIEAWLVVGMTLGQTVGPGKAGNSAPAAPAEASPSALADFQRDAEAYVIQVQLARPAPLKLGAQPLLHWGNPARNGEDGAVYAWMREGRPEVIGSIFTYRDRRDRLIRKHAFHSLSDQPLTAEFQSRVIWSPKTAGVKFASVPRAEAPAADPRRRLIQMRNLARQFSVQMIDLMEQKSELRLMSQPLLRYEPTAGAVTDGAIFAFAIGTDPEALLILEARGEKDSLRWQYAFARFHFVTLIAEHQGEEVWRVEPDTAMMRTIFGNDPQQREKVYYSVAKTP